VNDTRTVDGKSIKPAARARALQNQAARALAANQN
jgi:hypothetical protein